MNNIIYIKDVNDDELAELWWQGPGWYFIDETENYIWGGLIEEEAIKAFNWYVSLL